MDPLYYIQVGDIQPPQENRLHLLIDWGGLKGLGRKGLKESKSPKGGKARQKDQKVGGTCSRSQVLHLWRTMRRQQRPKKQQPERWLPKRISEGWSGKVEKLREAGRLGGRWSTLEEEEPLPEYRHSPTAAAVFTQKFYFSLPRYQSLV